MGNQNLKISKEIDILFLLVCFVCLEFFVPLENFSLICRRHHCRIRAVNFDLCSVLMAIKKWEFFIISVPVAAVTRYPFIMVISEDPWHSHLLPVVTTCFNDWGLSRLGFEHPTFRLRGDRSNPVRHSFNNITVTILIKLSFQISV